MIRRSRGYAPLPFFYGNSQGKDVLAIGGELKNCFCIGRNHLFYPSPYIGDMSDIRTVQALRESVQRMASLLEASPSVVACDLHPAYNTAAVARELGRPVVPIQHHYVHILSCMAENDCEQPVIGVSFDGTGYGTDGTIWGGEILISSLQGFERAASIEPFWQRGGDISAKEGWRIAVSLLDGLFDRNGVTAMVEDLKLCQPKELAAQFFLADQQINSVISTSAGRLFDGVSAILGLCRMSTFQGQAAMSLQFAAERWEGAHGAMEVQPIEPIDGDGRRLLPTLALVKDLVEKRLSGEDPDKLAYEFHCRLAGMVVGICESVRRETGLTTAAISGGVFQNRLLLSLCDKALQQRGFTVLRHSLVPPNDGGIALGQAIYAMYHETV